MVEEGLKNDHVRLLSIVETGLGWISDTTQLTFWESWHS